MKLFINKHKKIICIVLAVIILAAGGIFVADFIGAAKWKKSELVTFRYSTSGDMRGSTHSIEIKEQPDGTAKITYSDADSYDSVPVIKEASIDKAALSEIKQVFISGGMYRWENKKFSNMFIADGASRGYDFVFSDGESIGFSSQHYDLCYRSKLNKIHEIIENYTKTE